MKEKAKSMLLEGKINKVLGWKKGLFDDDVTPATFSSAEEIDRDFVYDRHCAANLSKYLIGITREIETRKSTTRMNNTMARQRNPEAVDLPIPSETVLVFLKPSDTHSFTELLKENRIKREDVYAVGIPCQDSLDGGDVCENCAGKKHVSCDELLGVSQDYDGGKSERLSAVEKFDAMSPVEKHEFWKNEFSRCIRCNACRNVCPACSCEKCVFDNNRLYTTQKVAETSFEESLFHIIRAWHVAGRCTDCGECSRVCPQKIPLHLLNRKYIKDINEIYGEYQAGSDMETKPPMLTYEIGDAEASIVWQRSNDGGAR